MSNSHPPSPLYRLMHRFNPRMVHNYQKGIGPIGMVLLLTTTGRKSGLPRTTPLQYEVVDSTYYVGSARGAQADWYRNIQANPHVEVQIGEKHFKGLAELVSDPERVANFLDLRMQRHPLFIGLLMRLEGLPIRYTQADMLRFATHKTLVIIHLD